jgi:glycosyltransferase involved in cell wall biosynthesis
MKILVLNYRKNRITGGELYNTLLFNSIVKNTDYQIEFCEPNEYSPGFSFKKIICPIIELQLIQKISKNDICFFSTSYAYRHFLLLLLTRIFFSRKKILAVHHHFEHEILKGFKKFFFRFLEIGFLNLLTHLIIPSQYVKERCQSLLSKKKNISYIGIPFKSNNDFFTKGRFISSELVFIGTVEHRKGLHLLIDSIHLLKQEKIEFKVNIVGKIIDQKYYESLLKKISSYKLENYIYFHGRVSAENLNKFLKNAYLFVFPSLLEGYGIVMMEAMAYGIPVVAYNNSAMPFLIKDGYNGFLSKNKDVFHFKNIILEIFKNPDLRATLSQGAIKTYNERYTEVQFEDDTIKFISSL